MTDEKPAASEQSRGQFITVEQVIGVEDEIVDLDKSQLAQIPQGALAFFVRGHKKPIIIKDPSQIVLGRRTPGGAVPAVELSEYGGTERGVSRQHAKITSAAGTYFLQDLDSTNGTWLNGQRLVPNQEQALNPTDHIRLGRLTVRVFFHSARPHTSTQRVVLKTRDLPGAAPSFYEALTPGFLLEAVGPYLFAIAETQRVIDDLLKHPSADVLIQSIHHAPLSVTLTGASKAIELVRAKIIPWEKAYISDIAQILMVKGQEKPQEQPKKGGLPGIGRRAKSDSQEVSLEKKLERLVAMLAQEMVSQIDPDLPEEKARLYVQRLLPHVKTLSFSSISLVVDDSRIISPTNES